MAMSVYQRVNTKHNNHLRKKHSKNHKNLRVRLAPEMLMSSQQHPTWQLHGEGSLASKSSEAPSHTLKIRYKMTWNYTCCLEKKIVELLPFEQGFNFETENYRYIEAVVFWPFCDHDSCGQLVYENNTNTERMMCKHTEIWVVWLVVSTHLKNISQTGSSPQVRVKKMFQTTTWWWYRFCFFSWMLWFVSITSPKSFWVSDLLSNHLRLACCCAWSRNQKSYAVLCWVWNLYPATLKWPKSFRWFVFFNLGCLNSFRESWNNFINSNEFKWEHTSYTPH